MFTKDEAEGILHWLDIEKFETLTGPEDEKDRDVQTFLSALTKLRKFCNMEPYKPWWKQ
jgi:hypothetical protein